MPVSNEQLLAEIDEIIRTQPTAQQMLNEDVSAWAGRALAVIAAWNPVQGGAFESDLRSLSTGNWALVQPALQSIPARLHRARYDVLLKVPGGGTKVVERGAPFDYFDELRKLVQKARAELFFVDPYINEEFVSSYIEFVSREVQVRILGREKMKTLMPAVEMARRQTGLQIEARSGSGFHDRFLFIDASECIQSSNSFHQGGAKTPAVLSQIVDAAPTLLQVYEGIWAAASS